VPTATAVLGRTEPRLFTPPVRELIPGDEYGNGRTTDGFAVIRFANDMLHMRLFPWQEWFLIHALELLPDGLPRFRIVIIEVARQNGKTMLEVVLALWRMYTRDGSVVIGTAQDLPNAERAWRDAVALAESDDELSELIPSDGSGIYLAHPKVFMLETGSEYRVAASNSGGGVGFSGDLILLDELRLHYDWDSWSGVTNTMNARPRAQAFAFSNAGDARSVVLRYQRAIAHRDLGWPDGEQEFEGVLDEIDAELAEMLAAADDLSPGWFEWSAPPKAKRNDLDALAQANPSMNHTEVTEECPTTRTLLSALSSPSYVYETQVMCRWPTMGLGGPFPQGSWESTQKIDAKPAEGSKSVVCVEISSRRMQTYIARAGLKDDGVAVVGIWQDRPGTDWVREYLVSQIGSLSAIVLRTDTGSPALTLLDDWLKDSALANLIIEWKGADVPTAHDDMIDRLRDSTIEHLPHPGLDMAATSAVERLKPGGSWTIDILRSPTDVAPLYATIGAVWALAEVSTYNVLESVW
jgi:hypothetical protein